MLIEKLLPHALRSIAIMTGALCVLMLAFLCMEGWQAWSQIGPGQLLGRTAWYPSEGTFGMAAMVVGSVAVTAGALLIAVPVGVISGVFGAFLAPRRLGRLYRRAIELLAGVPSVVYGFWGLVYLVPVINRIHPPGASVLAGALVLGLMVLPTIALATEQALRAVPPAQIDGALSLGMSRWGMILHIALPHARQGIMAGVVLQTGRAIGETMVVLMVCGNVAAMPGGLFAPVRTLTANIALEMSYAMGDHRSALFAGGALLMVLVLLLVLLAERLQGRHDHAG